MPDGPQESPYGEPLKDPGERELFKTVPVLFILGTITGLYAIYVCAHLIPMLQLYEPPNTIDPDMQFRGLVESCIFNVIVLMLVTCYIRCALVHPGEVPNAHPWLYTSAFGVGGSLFTEAKRSGERRHCKWCGKYKPDRCHHCRVCRTCVLKMDHHCPWIYNCVGFHNYKYFFLLLFYTMLATHFIMWTMAESMLRSVDENAPFLEMFFIMFGLTLAAFLGTLVTLFFGFHCWLVAVGLSTIEFCEKKFPKKEEATDRGGGCFGDCMENDSPYNLGVFHNTCSVLGYNPFLWLLPFTGSPGDGLTYQVVDLGPSRSFEVGRGANRKPSTSQKLIQAQIEASLAAGELLQQQQKMGLHSYGTLCQTSSRPSW